jgi:hypothetical protein
MFQIGLLANGWKLQSPITELHRQVIRHARRTNKKRSLLSKQPFCGADGTRTRDPRRDRPLF